jgi:NAD(P)-dependent dehydrogenase (short-subunit alcohol dehydrogenase family)
MLVASVRKRVDALDMASLEGLVAVITGGTGGLGRAVVDVFLAEGARVAVPSRGGDSLDALKKAHAQLDRLIAERADLSNEESAAAWFRSIAERASGIDVLVNCAGGWAGGKSIAETPWSIWEMMIRANLETTVVACRAVIPHLVARGGGSIVNVSSRAATVASPNNAAYAASKRAVVALTESLAAELHGSHVSANAVLPSIIDTPKNRDAGMTKGVVEPEVIARVIAFLASREGRVISGASIPVYG